MEKIQVTGDIKVINNGVLVIQINQPVNLTDGNYEITIKDIPKKRSLRQNRYLWALIGEIAQREDGDLRNQENLYTHLLEMAGAKYEIIYIDEQAINSLLEHEIIRHIVIKGKQIKNNRVMCQVYLFYGSSKMDTKEMSDLIDTTLRYAAELGIYTPYWEELLKC